VSAREKLRNERRQEKERTKRIEIVEGSHPIPDERSVEGARKIVELLKKCGKKDLVLVLISGGGSSLLCYPKVNLELFQGITRLLIKSGADIKEINCVRKKLSNVKGGKLAKFAENSEVVSLIISDVVGDPLGYIASGPTVSDYTTGKEAIAILKKYGLTVPEEVIECLKKEERATISKAKNFLISSNRASLEKMRDLAESFGYNSIILSTLFEGDAKQIGKFLGAIAKESSAKVAWLCGGEATVKVEGNGIGGPNMEIAASFAREIEGLNLTIGCMGSDGEDGSTYGAGAIADGSTVKRAIEKGMNIDDYLENNDTLTFFKELGDLIVTGSTGTNVNSFWVVLVK